MPSSWLTALAWVALAVAFGSAGLIVFDIYGRGYRLKMPIMEAVWPATALYFGPAAVLAYRRYGRPTSRAWLNERRRNRPPDKPGWASTALSVSHCGAGCVLGDIAAEFAVFGLGLTVAGTALPYEYLGDYVLALSFGIVFQYFVIAPMRGLGLRDGLKAAAKADVLALTSFEVGLFGWMALMAFVFYPAPDHLHPDTPVYWFLMQIGMIIGFATSWPVNVWLLRRGIKEAM